MKKTIWLSFFLLISYMAFAQQTQQGIVKTRGRMVNGVLQKGTPLSGATIQIKDRSAMVSGSDGKFSFPLRTNSYLLQNVKKNGYQLVDMEVCRDHKYSADPLYIVMETPEQQQSDLLAAERRIRKNLQLQLQRREIEIENLQVSQQEKDSLMRILYQQQGDNEKLISDMAKRYATLDYDQLDDFYRQVSSYIESGELSQADSLLRTRGDIRSQVQGIINQGRAIQEKELELKKAKTVQQADKEEAAQRCYSFYEAFNLQHMNDSAFFYLKLRLSIDSTNVDWIYDIGKAYWDCYIFDEAMDYYQRGGELSFVQAGNKFDPQGIAGLMNICKINLEKGDAGDALEYYSFTYHLLVDSLRYDTLDNRVACCLNGIGAAFIQLDKFDEAETYCRRALNIMKKNDMNKDDLTSCYRNLGYIYYKKGEYSKSIDNLLVSLIFSDVNETTRNLEQVKTLQLTGYVCKAKGLTDEAIKYLSIAYKKVIELYGENHPYAAFICSDIGNLFMDEKKYREALFLYEEAIKVMGHFVSHSFVSAEVSEYEKMSEEAFANHNDQLGADYLSQAIRRYHTTLNRAYPYYLESLRKAGDANYFLAKQETNKLTKYSFLHDSYINYINYHVERMHQAYKFELDHCLRFSDLCLDLGNMEIEMFNDSTESKRIYDSGINECMSNIECYEDITCYDDNEDSPKNEVLFLLYYNTGLLCEKYSAIEQNEFSDLEGAIKTIPFYMDLAISCYENAKRHVSDTTQEKEIDKKLKALSNRKRQAKIE